jgi:hypothetical protein
MKGDIARHDPIMSLLSLYFKKLQYIKYGDQTPFISTSTLVFCLKGFLINYL